MEMKIGNPTPKVKVQVMAGINAVTKVSTIRVTPNTRATADLIISKLVNSIGCKIKKDQGKYRITGVDKKEQAILGTTTEKLRLPTGDWE